MSSIIYTAGDRTPYVYVIRWTKLKLNYLGVRFARGCHPDDFWTKYFTSSTHVKRIRSEHGDPDSIKVLRTFPSIEEAQEWEHMLLEAADAVHSPLWLNKHDPKGKWFNDGTCSREQARKMVANGTHNFLGGKISRAITKKRIAEGTHHFLGENNPSHKKVAEGTHHFLGGELQKETQRKRVAEGTHHFLGGELQKETQRKRVAEGTHHFLGGENNRKRVAEGTHPFLGGEISRETQRKRVENGTHHFLGGEISKETQRKRIAEGTHNFLGGEIQKETQRKRVENGTHHFLGGESNRKRIEDGTHNFLKLKGTIWVCTSEVSVRITPNQLDEYLSKGYHKRRKFKLCSNPTPIIETAN